MTEIIIYLEFVILVSVNTLMVIYAFFGYKKHRNKIKELEKKLKEYEQKETK